MSKCKCNANPRPPVPSECDWKDDRDYLDGATELPLDASLMRAYWDTDILDVHGVKPGKIIRITDAFKVRFRVELVGDLWRCVCGDWCFELGFTAIGKGGDFDLSDHIGRDQFDYKDWKGCDTLCIEVPVDVRPGAVPADVCSGTLYEVGARFALHCCGKRTAVVGFEALEEYQFYNPDAA
jgi:hypothetical protein